MSAVGLQPLRRFSTRHIGFVAATLVFVIAVWIIYVDRIYAGNIPLPTPTSTFEAFRELLASGELQQASLESLQVLVMGSIPGIVIGIAAGLVIGASRPLDATFGPYLFAFYATPFPALIPVFILLFGIGTIGKGMIVFTLVVATVVLQTIAGVKNIDPRFLEVSRSLSASRTRTLVQVQFPAALSFIIAGIRLAIGRALVGVVVAEFDTALSGLGALIFKYAGRFQLSEAFVAALVFSAVGVAISVVLRRAEGRFERWRQVGA
jgi:NitT/TauT family transport system permease protein